MKTKQFPQPAKLHIETLVKLMGEKIVERWYLTPNGCSTDRPSRGEFSGAVITRTNKEKWGDLLTNEGFEETYNGGVITAGAFCYYKDFGLESEWGTGLQFFPESATWRICYKLYFIE